MGILTSLTESYGLEVPNTSIESETFSVSEDTFGLFQVSADSEMAWNNIMVETLIKEHEGNMLEEGQVLLDEAAKEFAGKVIEWIKQKARKLKDFFKSLRTRLRYAIMNVDKFVKQYGKDIRTFNGPRIKTHTPMSLGIIRDWKDDAKLEKIGKGATADLAKVSKLAKETPKSTEELYSAFRSSCKSSKDVTKSIREDYLKSEDAVNEIWVLLGNNYFSRYVDDILDGASKTTLSMVSGAEKSCNDILSSMMKEAKSSNDSKKIAYQKACSSLADTVAGAYISLTFSRMGDAILVCKGVVRAMKATKIKEDK